ncbi:putative membrane protein [Nymphaea thermarum]|nr:putative membrane protein [Nymphaea thermarum]
MAAFWQMVSPLPHPALLPRIQLFPFTRKHFPTALYEDHVSQTHYLRPTKPLDLRLHPEAGRWVQTRAHGLRGPLISSDDHWGTSERTRICSALSGAVVSTLVGLLASNLGILPSEAPAYSMVMEYLLPLTVPLLLFRADLRHVIQSTGLLLLVFLLGSVGTTLGTLVAFLLVPMHSLGQDGWKMAAALMSSNIGGAVNYVAVSKALNISSSVLAAGLAADNVTCALYLASLFALAAKIPPEISMQTNERKMKMDHETSSKVHVLDTATALALSFAVCKFGTYFTKVFHIPGGNLPSITGTIIILATLFPHQFNSLALTGEGIALILIQAIGASGSIWNVIHNTPSILLFALVQIYVHLAFLLGVGRLLGFDRKLLLLASNANIGGPTTACGMATAKEWGTLIVPAALAGIFGISIATFLGIGFGSERTRIGSALSGALVSTLVALAASNLGILPSEAPAYSMVMEYLLPLSVPLLLFRADLRQIIRSTGRLLLAFLLGSVATILGTLVAFLVVPMRSLGQDGWKIAAALMSRHIGGAVNYVAVSKALNISSSVLAAGLAADNVICALYFSSLFALAAKIPPETSTVTNKTEMKMDGETSSKTHVLDTATALALSFSICKFGTFLTKVFHIQGGNLPTITGIIVILATLFPHQLNSLAPAGEVGASGSIWNVIHNAPSVFLFSLIQIVVHLAFLLGVGKLLGFERKLLLLASNANVGGPTTACGMATTKEWRTLMVPAILAGIFGISIATFLGIGFGFLYHAIE